jgi:hypothetical protein
MNHNLKFQSYVVKADFSSVTGFIFKVSLCVHNPYLFHICVCAHVYVCACEIGLNNMCMHVHVHVYVSSRNRGSLHVKSW